MKVCRLPHRPLQVLPLAQEMNLDLWSCLSFDMACFAFNERFQLEHDATKAMELTPEEQKQDYKPTKLVPTNSHKELVRLPAIAVDDAAGATAGDQMI
jgi:hypothetical protein